MPNAFSPMGGIFILFWLLWMAAAVTAIVVLLVALWRAMKAHESIARSMGMIARDLRVMQARGGPPPPGSGP